MILYPETEAQRLALCQWASDHIAIPTNFRAALALGVVRRGTLVAVACYDHYRPPNIEMSIAASHPSWATPATCFTLLQYPFNIDGIHRLTAFVCPDNGRSRKLVEGVGFVQEGVLRAGRPDGSDMVIYGMTRADFERSKVNGKR